MAGGAVRVNVTRNPVNTTVFVFSDNDTRPERI